jgi:hypothetical protein
MEITKEQVLDLYGTTGNCYLHGKLKEWFPEAFKVELEVGKWYFHDKSKSIVNYQGGTVGYGFNALNNWCSSTIDLGWSFKTHAKEWVLATTEQWESALIAEAKKRGYKNCNYECLYMSHRTKETDEKMFFDGGCIWIGVSTQSNMIYEDGVWAEIIKTFSKEEAEKLLGAKII